VALSRRQTKRNGWPSINGFANRAMGKNSPPWSFSKPMVVQTAPSAAKAATLEWLIRRQRAVLALAFELGVPFTKNQAERDSRSAKVKQKVSNCLRTLVGASCYARIFGSGHPALP